jgi:hypothetical protein
MEGNRTTLSSRSYPPHKRLSVNGSPCASCPVSEGGSGSTNTSRVLWWSTTALWDSGPLWPEIGRAAVLDTARSRRVSPWSSWGRQ